MSTDFLVIDVSSRKRKKIRSDEGSEYEDSGFSASWRAESDSERTRTFLHTVDHSDPFSLDNVMEELYSGKYGSVTKDIQELIRRRRQFLDSFFAVNPALPSACLDVQNITTPKAPDPDTSASTQMIAGPVVVIDSDEEPDCKSENLRPLYMGAYSNKPAPKLLMKDFMVMIF